MDFSDPTDAGGGTPPIQISAAYGSVTLRFMTVIEAQNTLTQMRNSSDPVLVEAVKAVEKNFADLLTNKPSTSSPATPANSPGSAKQLSDKTCQHGQRNLVKGISAKGPWVGHFCPLEKGDPAQCKPIFGN